MKLTIYKVSSFVVRRYRIILVLLLIAFSLSGFYAYTALTPGHETQTENERVTLYEYKAGYDHHAVVEQENPLWPVGWTLTNQPLYFSFICPNLDLGFNFQITGASESETMTAQYLTKLVLSSSSENTTYWRKEIVLSNGTAVLDDMNALYNPSRIKVTEINEEINAVQEALHFRGGNTNAKIITSVRYTGYLNGERIDTQKEIPLDIEIGSSTYKVSSRNYEEIITRDIVHTISVPKSPSTNDIIISASVPVTFLVLIILFTFVKLNYRPLDETVVQELVREKEYEKYKELISKGALPSDIERRDLVRITVRSLEDLANIAIDKDERVIFDEEAALYFIIHNDLMYECRKDSQ